MVGHWHGRHCLYENDRLVFEGDRIVCGISSYRRGGAVARRTDYGQALISPSFVDLDAQSDLDTTILDDGNLPAWNLHDASRAIGIALFQHDRIFN